MSINLRCSDVIVAQNFLCISKIETLYKKLKWDGSIDKHNVTSTL
jgi:hypothetical protein